MNQHNKKTLARVSLALVAAAVLSACASNTTTAASSSNVRDEDEFVTGSRIPQRDRTGVRSMSREEFERRQKAGAHSLPGDFSGGATPR